MTIQDLGSVGELVAAIATVATLIYLSVQIRSNTAVVRAESRRGVTGLGLELQGLIASSREVASIFRRGVAAPASLDADESIQFTFLFSMLVSQSDSVFTDYRLGIAERALTESSVSATLRLLRTRGGRKYWGEWAVAHTPEFRQYVDERLQASAP